MPYETYKSPLKEILPEANLFASFRNHHSHKRGSQPRAYILQSQLVVTIHPPIRGSETNIYVNSSTCANHPLISLNSNSSHPNKMKAYSTCPIHPSPMVGVAGLKHMKKQTKKNLFF